MSRHDRLAPVMIAGTGSDVGKSVIATGLCRIFRQDGYTPAPFKAQNMALNSYVTPDGLEIGRAQAVQAEAAGLECSSDMNPLLLKPSGMMTSQIVLNGRPLGNCEATEYYSASDRREYLRHQIHDAYDRLSSVYNPIVLEGAGSISELNLRDTDLVNMSMARYAGARVILVADIDRGGVFASVYGSVMLQSEADRAMIRGVIINKFRGDLSLFDSGRQMLESITGIPVLGVVPYATDIHIDEEDSVTLATKQSVRNVKTENRRAKIAVVRLDHISNFTDFNALEHNHSVALYYASQPDELDDADIIIIPGSKNTIADIERIRRNGVADAIVRKASERTVVAGVCGGYQMLGESVADPDGVEGNPAAVAGLGLLPVATVMKPGKTTRRVEFRFMDSPDLCSGYEIHSGETRVTTPSVTPLNILADGSADGCIAGNVIGSYIHGIFDNQCVVSRMLAMAGFENDEKPFDSQAYRQEQYDLLADHLRRYIDIDKLYKILT